jgi:hypothetical protein
VTSLLKKTQSLATAQIKTRPQKSETVLNAVPNLQTGWGTLCYTRGQLYLQTGWERENKHFGKQPKHVKAATYTKGKKDVAT